MGSLLPLLKSRQTLVLLGLLLTVRWSLGPQHLPSRVIDFLARSLPLHLPDSALHCGSREEAVGIEHTDKATGHQVVHLGFHLRHALGLHARRDDGMMVGDLAVVEHLLALGQFLSLDALHQGEIGLHAVEYLRTFGIDVVTQEGGVHTRISGELLLVKALDKLQGGVGAEAELLVAFHLQAGEVEQAGRGFRPLLSLYIGDAHGQVADSIQGGLSLLPGGKAAVALLHHGRKDRVPVEGGKHPIRNGHKVLNLLLACHNEGKRGGLHTSHAEHLVHAGCIFLRIEACGVHAQQPVADGTHEACFVKGLVLGLVLQFLETLANTFLRKAVNPQALHGATGIGQLHHPPLYQFTLLPGIPAVDDAIGMGYQPGDCLELLLHALVALQLDAKAGRYHGQLAQAPFLPQR